VTTFRARPLAAGRDLPAGSVAAAGLYAYAMSRASAIDPWLLPGALGLVFAGALGAVPVHREADGLVLDGAGTLRIGGGEQRFLDALAVYPVNFSRDRADVVVVFRCDGEWCSRQVFSQPLAAIQQLQESLSTLPVSVLTRPSVVASGRFYLWLVGLCSVAWGVVATVRGMPACWQAWLLPWVACAVRLAVEARRQRRVRFVCFRSGYR
jgi:hypothetical protein